MSDDAVAVMFAEERAKKVAQSVASSVASEVATSVAREAAAAIVSDIAERTAEQAGLHGKATLDVARETAEHVARSVAEREAVVAARNRLPAEVRAYLAENPPPAGKASTEPGPKGTDGDSFQWRGPWDGRVTYEPRDVVSLDGSSWIAKVRNRNTRPGSGEAWDLLAQRGKDGTSRGGGAPVRGGGVRVLDENDDLGIASSLRFTGAGVTATPDGTTGTVNVEIPGGGGSGDTPTLAEVLDAGNDADGSDITNVGTLDVESLTVDGVPVGSSIEEVYGPDLITGDSQDFAGGTVGDWVASDGALTAEPFGPAWLGSPSGYHLQFVPDDVSQYIELPVAGTFLTGHRYGLVLAGFGTQNGISFGDIGAADTTGVGTTKLAINGAIWTPSGDRSSVSVRITATDALDTFTLFFVRVVEVFDGVRLPGDLFLGGSLHVATIEGVGSFQADIVASGGNTVLTEANRFEALDPIPDPPTATTQEVAEKVNELLDALLGAGLAVD